jgi:hypothetical protein
MVENPEMIWIEMPHKTNEYTPSLINIAMDNGPFIDGLPIKNGDFL